MSDSTLPQEPAASVPPPAGRSRFAQGVLGAGLPLSLLGLTGVAAALGAALAAGLAAATQAVPAGSAAWLGALCMALLAPLALVPWLRLLKRHDDELAEGLAARRLLGVPPGWHDRRQFLEMADREWARSRRYDEDGALLLVDADHHASVLQSRGPACADALLVQAARVARATLRHPDLMARFGEEGMAVFLPHTDPLGALDVAERIRERVAAARLRWDGADLATTVSVGVASIGSGHAALDALIADAGRALHAAKDAGRNCVRAAPIQPRRNGERRPKVSR